MSEVIDMSTIPRELLEIIVERDSRDVSNWVAVDEDGMVYAYIDEPELMDGYWSVAPGGKQDYAKLGELSSEVKFNYKKSLCKIT